MTVTTPFDQLAHQYDALWTNTPVGFHQRRATWARFDRLFRPGHFLLDVGCGTGEDALHLEAAGMYVCGIDTSAEMVRIANRKGADAHLLTVSDLSDLSLQFDGVISNFGVLN